MATNWHWTRGASKYPIRYIGRSEARPGWDVSVERGQGADRDDLVILTRRGRTPKSTFRRRISSKRVAATGSTADMHERLMQQAEVAVDAAIASWEVRQTERSRARCEPAAEQPESDPIEPEPVDEGCTRVEVPELGIVATATTADPCRAAHDVVSEFLWDEPGLLAPDIETVEATTITTAATELVQVAVTRARRWFTDKLTGANK